VVELTKIIDSVKAQLESFMQVKDLEDIRMAEEHDRTVSGFQNEIANLRGYLARAQEAIQSKEASIIRIKLANTALGSLLRSKIQEVRETDVSFDRDMAMEMGEGAEERAKLNPGVDLVVLGDSEVTAGKRPIQQLNSFVVRSFNVSAATSQND
jgi:hypothetical protein